MNHGPATCRHVVGIACVVAVILADRDGIIGPNTPITGISREDVPMLYASVTRPRMKRTRSDSTPSV